MVNGQDIYGEVAAAVADWKMGSFRAAGLQIGRALSKLLVQDFDAWKLRRASPTPNPSPSPSPTPYTPHPTPIPTPSTLPLKP